MTGVYKITNLHTNDFYIGSTSQSFNKRCTRHFSELKRNKHGNKYLQEIYNSLGEEYLRFEILEHCPKHECIEREQHYINNLSPKYNIAKTAKNTCVGIKRSNEFVEHMKSNNVKKIYKILHVPTQLIIFECNFTKFCLDNSLKRHKLLSTHSESKATKKYHKHKGFKILEKINIEEMLKEYSITKQF